MDGMLLVDKPASLTSHNVIMRLRKRLRTRQIGHAGTLDPMATGLLVALIGEGTKLVPYATGCDKTYEATVSFGTETSSHDADGTVIRSKAIPNTVLQELANLPTVSKNSFLCNKKEFPCLVAALEAEEQRREQVPPAVSAIHVDGMRAHERVRQGETVVMAPRPVEVLGLEVLGACADPAWIKLRVRVSAGYYVRALARDLGARLGTVAHLSMLRRTNIGRLAVEQAVSLDAGDLLTHVLPLEQALAWFLPRVALTEQGALFARQGKKLAPEMWEASAPDGLGAWMLEGTAVAIGRIEGEVGRVVRGFSYAQPLAQVVRQELSSYKGYRCVHGARLLILDSSRTFIIAALSTATLNAVCATADAALRELSPARLASLIEHRRSDERELLERFAHHPERVLSRWLTARVLLAAITAVLVHAATGALTEPVRSVVSVGLTALLHGLLASTGAAIGRTRAVSFSPGLLRVMRPVELMVAPLAIPIAWIGDLASRSVAPRGGEEESIDAESEMEFLVEGAERAGEIDAEPAEIIRNVLDFKDLLVRDVMIPRIKVTAIEETLSLQDALDRVAQEGHSRFPVYRRQIDNIVGILYAKDLLKVIASEGRREQRVQDVMRTTLFFVPQSKSASNVLQEMRARGQHLAICVDEFGGVNGLVTLEDILEQIVGEIRDEHDADEAPIQDLGAGRLLADASVSLVDLSAYLGSHIEAGEMGSLGGLLTHAAGKVPGVGEHLFIDGFEFIVREADARHPIKVEIVLPPPSTLEPISKFFGSTSAPLPLPRRHKSSAWRASLCRRVGLLPRLQRNLTALCPHVVSAGNAGYVVRYASVFDAPERRSTAHN